MVFRNWSSCIQKFSFRNLFELRSAIQKLNRNISMDFWKRLTATGLWNSLSMMHLILDESRFYKSFEAVPTCFYPRKHFSCWLVPSRLDRIVAIPSSDQLWDQPTELCPFRCAYFFEKVSENRTEDVVLKTLIHLGIPLFYGSATLFSNFFGDFPQTIMYISSNMQIFMTSK